ncbi:class IV adenylate cyclase [Streptomyces sp. NPDC051555]|uniref:class IV adenylate cyclase n=1 Tax=Streptomyces sp. NPDC051555 TaxID=3365657 RepID=UPI0037891D35
MIEAELKARVQDRAGLLAQLEALAKGRVEVYRDTYYDTADGALAGRDAELRVRTVEAADGTARTVLTYKGAAVDADSGSKPEHETTVADADAVHAVVQGLGYRPLLAFTKACINFDLVIQGRRMLATVVQVPEINGATFIEVETMTGRGSLDDALADVKEFISDLGIDSAAQFAAGVGVGPR